MIIQLQKKFKGKLFQFMLWFIAALFLLPLSITQIISFFTSESPWLIKVNGQGISKTQVQSLAGQFELQIKQLEQQYPQFASMYLQMMGLNQDPRQLAIDSLVRQTLLYQASQTVGLPVAEALVRKEFQSIDPYVLRNQLRQAGISMMEFEQEVSRSIAVGMLETLVKQATYVPEFMMKDYYKANFLGKQFSIVPFKLDEFVAKEQAKQPSQEIVKAFFEEQNTKYKRYQTPEKRSGYAWKFDPAFFGVSVSDDEVARYYQANKSQYKDKPAQIQVRRIIVAPADADAAQAQQQAQEIRTRILNGTSFETVVQEYAKNDAQYGAQAGLMPLFAAGTHEKEFEKAAFILEKNGDVSQPVITEQGVMLLQRVDKKPQTFKSLEAVATDIKTALTQQRFNAEFLPQARKAIEQAKGDVAALEAFATAKGGKKQSLNKLTADQSSLAQALFKLKPQSATALQEGDLGTILLLQSVEPAAIPAFETVAQSVTKDYVQVQAKTALQEELKKAKADAQGLDPQAFKKLFGTKVEQTALIKPSDETAVANLKKRGISMLELFQLEKVGDVALSYSGQDGFIVRLDALEPFNEQEFKAKKAEFKANVERQEEQSLFMGFVASLYRNATIKQK